MKRERLDDFWEISQTEGLTALHHCGEVKLVVENKVASKIADQILAWSIPSVYNFKDEDGNPVPDEIVMSHV